MESLHWQGQGKCVGEDPEIFFLPHNARMSIKRERVARAKKICDGCPVIEQCLEFALSMSEEYGVWGGMSEDERRKILVRRNRVHLQKN